MILTEKYKSKLNSCHQNFKKGENIYRQTDAVDHVYILNCGFVKLSKILPTGDEIMLDLAGPGEVFGRCFPGDLEEAAVALKDCSLNIITTSNWSTFIGCNAEFRQTVLKLAGRRLRHLEMKVENLQFANSESRIRNTLRYLVSKYGETTDKGDRVMKIQLTHSDLSRLAGTSRQTVTSFLSRLKGENELSYKRNGIVIYKFENF